MEDGGVLELYTVERDDGVWEYLPGQGQLCFVVHDVDASAERVLAAGGSRFGEISDWSTPSDTFRFVYLRDPEGTSSMWQAESVESSV